MFAENLTSVWNIQNKTLQKSNYHCLLSQYQEGKCENVKRIEFYQCSVLFKLGLLPKGNTHISKRKQTFDT